MKKIIVLAIALTASYFSFAQDEDSRPAKTVMLRANLELGFPIGNNLTNYSFIVGGTGEIEYKPSKSFGATLNAGYLQYTGNSNPGGTDTGIIPVMLGVKGYSHSAFLHAQAGAAFETTLNSQTSFAFAIGFGHKIVSTLTGEVKFMELTNKNGHVNSLGLSIGYSF